MHLRNKEVAIFIMPRSSTAWKGAEAMWITVAGWGMAAKKILGGSVVVTSDRIADPVEVYNYPLGTYHKGSEITRKIYTIFPVFLRVIFGDLFTWAKNRDWKILNSLDYNANSVAFVWEKHDLFTGPGRKLAKDLNVPFVSYVHAPVIWESEKWGVKRYWWGRYLERKEAAILKKADYVAVVSEEVKEKVLEMGVAAHKIFISPMAVDPEYFIPNEKRKRSLKRDLQIENRFVIGWTGSFRSFHALDDVIRAFYGLSLKYPQVTLLLVGDGADMEASRDLAKKLQIQQKIIFTGRKPFREIPDYISVFDMALVSACTSEGFHYSPLKLREYLAAGKPVLAPNAGEIPGLFKDETHLKLFQPGNLKSLQEGMEFFLLNKRQRLNIAKNGKEAVINKSTWEVELEKCLRFIKYKE